MLFYYTKYLKRLSCAFICSLLGMMLWAVPAERRYRTVWMHDGTTQEACLFGDEYFSWMETREGRIIEPSGDGKTFIFAESTVQEVRQAAMKARQKAVLRIGSQETAPLSSKGSAHIPVILVQFQDSVFTIGNTRDEIRHYYDLYCNGTRDGNRYTKHGSYGSIRDYFLDQSDGVFQPEFTIIGPVTLPQNEKYYVNRNNTMVKQAVTLATSDYEGTWKDFDSRNKNQVDMVFLIFAGCGANTTGDQTNHIWPSEQPFGRVSLDNGQTVNFVCSGCCPENRLYSSKKGEYTRADGIGVMCHEMSHALGLPDFYDTNYQSFGMDLWSLMDYGCYGRSGYYPCSYTAYERDFMGWRDMEELTINGTYTLTPIADNGIGYKIVNDENPNEFYVLENRQRVGWDQGIFYNDAAKPGLQITHVDYNANRWNNNYVNTDKNHQRMTIIAANNRYVGTYDDNVTMADLVETWNGNLYPYTYKDAAGVTHCNDSLTAYSVPAATVYTASGFMNKDIHAIRQNDDQTVSFYFGNDYVSSISETPAASYSQEMRDTHVWYDLCGRQIRRSSSLPHGLYINQYGRKVLIR